PRPTGEARTWSDAPDSNSPTVEGTPLPAPKNRPCAKSRGKLVLRTNPRQPIAGLHRRRQRPRSEEGRTLQPRPTDLPVGQTLRKSVGIWGENQFFDPLAGRRGGGQPSTALRDRTRRTPCSGRKPGPAKSPMARPSSWLSPSEQQYESPGRRTARNVRHEQAGPRRRRPTNGASFAVTGWNMGQTSVFRPGGGPQTRLPAAGCQAASPCPEPLRNLPTRVLQELDGMAVFEIGAEHATRPSEPPGPLAAEQTVVTGLHVRGALLAGHYPWNEGEI